MVNKDELEKKIHVILDAIEKDEVNTSEKPNFSEEEIRTLKNLIKFMDGIKILRQFGQVIFYIVVSLGVIITNWEKIVNFLRGSGS